MLCNEIITSNVSIFLTLAVFGILTLHQVALEKAYGTNLVESYYNKL